MKRMVKNGDLLDVEPDGTITVAGKPIGGGGSNDRESTLTVPYSSNEDSYGKKIYIDAEIWNNINNNFYEIIKIYYSDGKPLGIFSLLKYKRSSFNLTQYASVGYTSSGSVSDWYGAFSQIYVTVAINLRSDAEGDYFEIKPTFSLSVPELKKENFDSLYKLADKPTEDGTYVLKATVSGGAVTYTWVVQS